MGQNERSETGLGSRLANRNIQCIGVAGAVDFLDVAACAIFVFVSGQVRDTHVSIVAYSSSTLHAEYLAVI